MHWHKGHLARVVMTSLCTMLQDQHITVELTASTVSAEHDPTLSISGGSQTQPRSVFQHAETMHTSKTYTTAWGSLDKTANGSHNFLGTVSQVCLGAWTLSQHFVKAGWRTQQRSVRTKYPSANTHLRDKKTVPRLPMWQAKVLRHSSSSGKLQSFLRVC